MEDEALIQPADTSQGTSSAERSLLERIRNPSPTGLFVALLVSVVPLCWPLLLYMALRYLTGHRAPSASSDKVADAEPGLPSTSGRAALRARGLAVLVSLVVGALYLVPRVLPTQEPGEWTKYCTINSQAPVVCPTPIPDGATYSIAMSQPYWRLPAVDLIYLASTTMALLVGTFVAIAVVRWAWRSLS